MSKILLIVESPAKAKTIKKYVGDGYEVLASKGHIKDLPKKGGVDIEKGFQETYELLEEKGKPEVVKAIRAAAKKADKVLLATDPDREGEAIAYHLMEVAKKANKDAEIKRVLFEEITKRGVKKGLDEPRDLDSNLYEAQRTRRVLDRIGGYPLSSLLWKKLAFGLSAGRVQTPALRIIVDRQHERDAFVPVDYWLVDARLKGDKPHSFMAALQSVDGKKLDKVGSRLAVLNEKDAARYVSDLKVADYQVKGITKRKASRKAPAPYTTSKLQQDAANRLSMPPKRTMRIAQQLYEGITLGRGKNCGRRRSHHLHAYRQRAAFAGCRERLPGVHRQEVRQGLGAREAELLQDQEAKRAGRSRSDSSDASRPAARSGQQVSHRSSAQALQAHLGSLCRVADDPGGVRSNRRRDRSDRGRPYLWASRERERAQGSRVARRVWRHHRAAGR